MKCLSEEIQVLANKATKQPNADMALKYCQAALALAQAESIKRHSDKEFI